MEKLVSVIIPLHNAEPYLRECLDSVLGQTYPDIEILIVENCSTDNSLAIAREYEQQHDNIHVFINEKPNASAARNLGVEHAKGEYIQYLDSDDTLEPGKISVQMDRLAELGYPDDIVMSGRWTILGKHVDDMSDNIKAVWHSYERPIELLLDFAAIGCCNANSIYLIHKKQESKVGGWDEELSLNDDGDFFARIFDVANHIEFCHDSIANYRHTEGSLSKQRNGNAIWSQVNALGKIAEVMAKADNPQKNFAIQKMFQSFLCTYYPYYPAQCG